MDQKYAGKTEAVCVQSRHRLTVMILAVHCGYIHVTGVRYRKLS